MKSYWPRFVLFLLLSIFVVAIWFAYMHISSSWSLFADNWFMTVVMIFGSFIAGVSSEGGGAIAYPVMTLIFNIEPEVARNFSFAIQSFGIALWVVNFINHRKSETKLPTLSRRNLCCGYCG